MTKTFVPILSKKQRSELKYSAFLYAVSEIAFIVWWLNSPLKNSNFWGYLLTSILLAYAHTAIWYYYFFVLRMQKLNPSMRIPEFRTALITTRVPSAEPFEVTKRTLLAMLNQDYRYDYDVWLADEDPNTETRKWCREHEVKISTRKGKHEYHMSAWPRRKKCKEGNLAYFYDKYGYKKYDIVFQFDADHVPSKDYTRRAIKAFNDETIGYVAAPSICSNNASESWSARGRLYTEAGMHGAYQLGLNNGFAPLCIGSHYGVRTAALRSIGGIGPELAEDFSTTFLMNAAGWNGAFVHNSIAHGDGPQTFDDCMKQEFQWSRSLTNLLLTIVPSRLNKLSAKKRFQMTYAVLWYPMIAITSIFGYALPIIAILTGEPIVSIDYLQYLVITFTQIAIVVSSTIWLRNQGVFRPTNAKVVSWESIFYNLARWPYIVWGIVHSVLDSLTSKENIFKITPKSKNDLSTLKLTRLFPYILLIIVPALIGAINTDKYAVSGYYYLNTLTYVFYLLLIAIILREQYREVAENLISKLTKNLTFLGLFGISVLSTIDIQTHLSLLVRTILSR